MKIAHVSMFGPHRCGLYEASRDMAKADILSGHTVYFIDAGISKRDGTREEGKTGAVDERAGFKLITAHPSFLDEVDVIIMHTGIEDIHLVKNQAPIIWVVHGKPLDCVRPEQEGKATSYSLYADLSNWKRVKKMLHFWPEYIPYWQPVFPNEKHICFDYPVIDEQQFLPEGEKYILENAGKYNILICDSVRTDIDLFELAIGCIEVAKKFPNEFKFHFFGFEHEKIKCWQSILVELKKVGSLGDIKNRFSNMEQIYRSVDCVFSPNRINNRVVAESLCCGIPVIQEIGGNGLGNYFCNIPNTNDVIEAFSLFKNDFDNKLISKSEIIKKSKVFNLKNFSKKMNTLYDSIL